MEFRFLKPSSTNDFVNRPINQTNDIHTYMNTINSFFSIRLKYILIGFLRLYDQIDHDLEAFKWKSLTFLTSIGIGSIGAIELRANNSIAVRNGDIGVFESVGRSSNLLWRFYLFLKHRQISVQMMNIPYEQ